VTTEYKRDACGWCEGKDYCHILREEPDCENCPLALQCIQTPQFSEGNCDHMQPQWAGVLSPTMETDNGLVVPDLQRKIVCQFARELLLENIQWLCAHTLGPTELTVNKEIFKLCHENMVDSRIWMLICPRCGRSARLGYVMSPRELPKERPMDPRGKIHLVTQISMVCSFCGLDEKVDVP